MVPTSRADDARVAAQPAALGTNTGLGALHDEIGRLRGELAEARRLSAEAERLGQTGIWEVNAATGLVTWSEGTCRIFGVEPNTPMTIERAMAFYPPERRQRLAARIRAAMAEGAMWEATEPFVSASGEPGWVHLLGFCETDAKGVGRRYGFARDVTQAVTTERRLRELADRDPLTALWNRRACLDHLGVAVTACESLGGVALAVLDIDDFKNINDLHGHIVGDSLLLEVARRLPRAMRPGDTVARLGGDEFALILPGLADEDAALRRLGPLRDLFEAPVETVAGALEIRASFGVALHPSGGATAEDLLRSADIALYQAKAGGRGQACVFRPELARSMEDRLGLLAEMRAGLARGELDVFYQPIVGLAHGRVRAVEALVRWRHPTRGLLLPGAFMPALLDPAMSIEIGDFVLARSLGQMREWLDAGVPVASLNVNVSEGQLRLGEQLIERIVDLLRENAIAPDRLKLELLESAFLGRQADAVALTIRQLRALGVVVALDDFGTGYASLTHVKQFNVGRIKIDRSFIKDLCDDPSDAAITRAIIDLGRSLGIVVTAEGIELPAQLAFLREASCECGQGYLFSRPLPADEVSGFLDRWYGGLSQHLLGVTPPGDAHAIAAQ